MQNLHSTPAHICQNCGHDLNGNYCSNCGQKSDEVFKKSVFSILGHFFEELFTWDSRFFSSMKYLFLRPGYLTHEYISGRIQKYVSPLKMFLFTSLVLFFIMIKSDPDQYKALVDEADKDDFMREFILSEQNSSSNSKELFVDEFNDQFNDNVTIYIFVIMFLFSVLLKIVYITKNYYYSEHVVFTLHFFTFVLWNFLLGVIAQSLGDISVLMFIYLVPGVYLFLAIKRVYHRTLWKAVIAGMFLTFSYWLLVTGWVIGTILLSAVRAA